MRVEIIEKYHPEVGDKIYLKGAAGFGQFIPEKITKIYPDSRVEVSRIEVYPYSISIHDIKWDKENERWIVF